MYKYNLKKAFTAQQMELALRKFPSDTDCARYLSNLPGAPTVSRQNVTYWRKQEDLTNKEINDERIELRERSPIDWRSQHVTASEVSIAAGNPVNVILVIPDLHIPYHHPDAFEFLNELRLAYNPDVVVSLGDEVDNHALSFHDSDPNLDSAGTELEKSREYIKTLEQIFPNMKVCHSNHGSLAYRRAKVKGIPVEMLRSYREILFPDGSGQGWDWAYSHKLPTALGDVMFKHQCSGDAVTHACHEGSNLIVGHMHGRFGVSWSASSSRLYYGGYSGCLIDNDSLAFAYGKEFAAKPILGATVIIDGVPNLIPMVLNTNGRWIHAN